MPSFSPFNGRRGADCPAGHAGAFASLVFTPRGGTGTNGQALNQGIIVDMSAI
jgi:hypothetical protein